MYYLPPFFYPSFHHLGHQVSSNDAIIMQLFRRKLTNTDCDLKRSEVVWRKASLFSVQISPIVVVKVHLDGPVHEEDAFNYCIYSIAKHSSRKHLFFENFRTVPIWKKLYLNLTKSDMKIYKDLVPTIFYSISKFRNLCNLLLLCD